MADRRSDHDHVLTDLNTRFDAVLEAIEATEGWVTNRVTSRKIILGELGDIESGGTLPDWRRLAAAVRADPWGTVAQQVLEAIAMSRPYGTSELLTAVIERARRDAAETERDQVAGEIRDLLARSGLLRQDFALRLGTSRPRLSTYLAGKVTPSAALMIRMRRVAMQAQAEDTRPSAGCD